MSNQIIDRRTVAIPGPANLLTIGSVTHGAVASATIEGSSPSQKLNLVLVPGRDGSNVLPTDEAIAETIGILSAASSSDGFLRFAGTVPGEVPVVKDSEDMRAGVWEMTHNSQKGYLFHLLAGQSMSHNAALLGLGVDNDGIGILIPNKSRGRGIVGDQRATVASPDAYWMHVTQRSVAAPVVRLEQHVPQAAPLIQLLSFSGSSGKLLEVIDSAGVVGQVETPGGVLRWNRNVVIQNQPNGDVPSWLEISSSPGVNESNSNRSYHGHKSNVHFASTGVPGLYYPYRENRASGFEIQTAPNLLAAEARVPRPEEVTAWSTHIRVSQANGLTVGVAGKVGFYGASPIAKPTGVGQTVADIHAALVRLGLIGG